jgi:protein-tyrosine phosphatase
VTRLPAFWKKARRIILILTEDPIPSPSRLLNWEACLNTRDLGGYPLLDGGQTRWGSLVRSDNIAQLTLAGQQSLIDYGIRTIIDMRFAGELARQPTPFTTPAASLKGELPQVLNLPLDHDQDLDLSRLTAPAEAMRDLYCRLLETNRGYVAAVLTAIARAPSGGVLFHCHGGKDRTGLIAALVLAAAGVPDEVIAEDYAMTDRLLGPLHARGLADPSLAPAERLYRSVLWTALPATMRQTLDYLNQRYGGAAGYLRSTPLLEPDLKRLQERLVERS